MGKNIWIYCRDLTSSPWSFTVTNLFFDMFLGGKGLKKWSVSEEKCVCICRVGRAADRNFTSERFYCCYLLSLLSPPTPLRLRKHLCEDQCVPKTFSVPLLLSKWLDSEVEPQDLISQVRIQQGWPLIRKIVWLLTSSGNASVWNSSVACLNERNSMRIFVAANKCRRASGGSTLALIAHKETREKPKDGCLKPELFFVTSMPAEWNLICSFQFHLLPVAQTLIVYQWEFDRVIHRYHLFSHYSIRGPDV